MFWGFLIAAVVGVFGGGMVSFVELRGRRVAAIVLAVAFGVGASMVAQAGHFWPATTAVLAALVGYLAVRLPMQKRLNRTDLQT
jgi:ABC-type Mn2+/Zn2+ transport system permease subunit